MLFDLAMAAAPVTASPGHQHQYRLAEDRQYHVQAKMVGRLLRGAGEAVKGISSTLAGMPLQKRKLKGVVYGEPGPEKYTRLTVRYLQLFLPISALPAISPTGGHKMELFAWGWYSSHSRRGKAWLQLDFRARQKHSAMPRC